MDSYFPVILYHPEKFNLEVSEEEARPDDLDLDSLREDPKYFQMRTVEGEQTSPTRDNPMRCASLEKANLLNLPPFG